MLYNYANFSSFVMMSESEMSKNIPEPREVEGGWAGQFCDQRPLIRFGARLQSGQNDLAFLVAVFSSHHLENIKLEKIIVILL